MTPAREPTSTVVVVVRERFSPFVKSLESLFATVDASVPVVVVEGGVPPSIFRQLAHLQSQRWFEWIHTEYYLLPHEARNLALPGVVTDFVVFADNDLQYEPGWLERLEANALREQADVVAPLICIGPPAASKIHHAGGELAWREKNGIRYLAEMHRLSDSPLTPDLRIDEHAPVTNSGVEFHCFLVRRAALARTGPLDERLVVSEHIEFMLRCLAADLRVTFEKTAVVTYLAAQPFRWDEFGYFFYRWNVSRAKRSNAVIEQHWGFPIKDSYRHRRWIKKHRQRAILSFYPAAMRQKIPRQWLLALFWPCRLLSVVQSALPILKRKASLTTAARPAGREIEKVCSHLSLS